METAYTNEFCKALSDELDRLGIKVGEPISGRSWQPGENQYAVSEVIRDDDPDIRLLNLDHMAAMAAEVLPNTGTRVVRFIKDRDDVPVLNKQLEPGCYKNVIGYGMRCFDINSNGTMFRWDVCCIAESKPESVSCR